MTKAEQRQLYQREFEALAKRMKEAGVSGLCEAEAICIYAALLNQWEKHRSECPVATDGLNIEISRVNGFAQAIEWVMRRCVGIANRSREAGDLDTADKFIRFGQFSSDRLKKEVEPLMAMAASGASDRTVN